MIDYQTHEDAFGRLDWQRDGESIVEEGYSTRLLGAEAVDAIVNRDRSRPLFLVLAFNAPHFPLQVPRRMKYKYTSRNCDRVRCAHLVKVEFMDFQIGRVLDALDLDGITKNTIVLFMSDNGGEIRFGSTNFPLRGEKGTLLEGGIRVPAVIRWPDVLKRGRKSTQYIRDSDVFATLEGAAGLMRRAPADGMNVFPALLSGRNEPREPFLFAVDSFDNYASNGQVQRAVIDNGFKLIVREFQATSGQPNWHIALFDIENDPYEANEISRQHPERVIELLERIAAWEELHPADGARAIDPPPVVVPAATLERCSPWE